MSTLHAKRFLREIVSNNQLHNDFFNCDNNEDFDQFLKQYEYSFTSLEFIDAYESTIFCCLDKNVKNTVDSTYKKFQNLISTSIKELFTIE